MADRGQLIPAQVSHRNLTRRSFLKHGGPETRVSGQPRNNGSYSPACNGDSNIAHQNGVWIPVVDSRFQLVDEGVI